jgi:hypothetical protein
VTWWEWGFLWLFIWCALLAGFLWWWHASRERRNAQFGRPRVHETQSDGLFLEHAASCWCQGDDHW